MEPTGWAALDASLGEDPSGRQALKTPGTAVLLATFRPQLCLQILGEGYKCAATAEIIALLALHITRLTDKTTQKEAAQDLLYAICNRPAMGIPVGALELLFGGPQRIEVTIPYLSVGREYCEHALYLAEELHRLGYRWDEGGLGILVAHGGRHGTRKLFDRYYLGGLLDATRCNALGEIDMASPQVRHWRTLQTMMFTGKGTLDLQTSFKQSAFDRYPLFASTMLLSNALDHRNRPLNPNAGSLRQFLSELQLPPDPTEVLATLHSECRLVLLETLYQIWRERAALPDAPEWYRARVAAISIGGIWAARREPAILEEDLRAMRALGMVWGAYRGKHVELAWREVLRDPASRVRLLPLDLQKQLQLYLQKP